MKRSGLLPLAQDERYSCLVGASVDFKGSRGQYSAKVTLLSDMSVLFVIHEEAGGLVQMKVQPLALSEHDNLLNGVMMTKIYLILGSFLEVLKHTYSIFHFSVPQKVYHRQMKAEFSFVLFFFNKRT